MTFARIAWVSWGVAALFAAAAVINNHSNSPMTLAFALVGAFFYLKADDSRKSRGSDPAKGLDFGAWGWYD